MKRTKKPNRRQLPLFPGFDGRQIPLWGRTNQPIEPVRAPCSCLEPGDIGERYEGIGGPMNEQAFDAENGS